jgi:carbon-monoxide dehydrogenase medium subunit
VQPLLSQALRLVAHATIRNRGTTVGSIAHADAAAEMPTVLCLLDGIVTAASDAWDPADTQPPTCMSGPLETALAHDEMLTEAWFPALPIGGGTAFDEVSRRAGDYALAGVGGRRAHRGRQGQCPVRVGLHLAQRHSARAGPERGVRRRQGRRGVAGSAPGALVEAQVQPEADIHASADYRRHLAGVLTRRVVGRRTRAYGQPVA